MNKTPVTILVGFLGSGKTTLLNEILTGSHGLKIAVIENDFGELNIEEQFIKKNSDEKDKNIIEMINGCVCCTMNGTMIQTLEKLLDKRGEFNHIIIEATGVASPGPIIQALKQSSLVTDSYTLTSVVGVVDSAEFFANLSHTKRDPEFKFEEQLIYSDLVILNKIDRIINQWGEKFSEIELNKIEDHLKKINIECEIVKTSFCKLDIEKLLTRKGQTIEEVASLMKLNDNHAHHGTNGIRQFSFELEGVIDPTNFQFCLNSLLMKFKNRLFRMKGIVCFPNNPKAVFLQGVNEHIEFQTSEIDCSDSVNKFIFIGIDLNNEVIERSVKNCLIK